MGDTDPSARQPRTIRFEDQDWVVFEGGRSRTGHGHLGSAHLRLVQFARAEEPDKPVREATASPRPIDTLHDLELIELLRSGREVPQYLPPDESAQAGGRRIRTGGARGRDRSRDRR